MRTKTHLFAVIAALSLTAAGLAARQQGGQKPPRQAPAAQKPDNPSWGAQTREEKRQLREVREKQGLKAAARLYGGYVENTDFHDEFAPDDLRLLAEVAPLVVRGLIKNGDSAIVLSGYEGYPEPVETIVTNYTLQVLDVYKGDSKLMGRDVTLRVPGGRIEFGGGLFAEVRVTGFILPTTQTEFVMFLYPNRTDKGVYSVAFGRHGLFEILPGGVVAPRGGAGTPLAKKAKRDFGAFYQQVHEAIAATNRAKRDR